MNRKTKEKTQGSSISGRFTNNESQLILDWWNTQSKAFESVKYLIEKEILQNGINNLNQIIPLDRDLDRLIALKENEHPEALRLIEQIYGITNKQISVSSLSQEEVITGTIGQTKINKPITPIKESVEIQTNNIHVTPSTEKEIVKKELKTTAKSKKEYSNEEADLGMSAADAEDW
ncbi:hypothetical protein [Chengkuizengella axinellae]|uniref:Uncharacterized protein n=1 Tax=Chengkuizengella axinellae TaxID=3064388 RepID=A0ABT9J3D8_9BACL|nr:hypothetical protein [Chengkuizengella sp. 2205SS18-9]MDP5276110.1 hypothetical protein [Chengkuizengella sp. 2205SS18-9]